MILGIETSTSNASLALYDRASEDIVWHSHFVSQRAHNAVIFDPIEEIMTQYRDQLSGIVVGIGPGSYGGVRVGISVANGISLVLGIPVVGKPSLEGWGVDSDSWFVLGDARRKTTFVAEVENHQLVAEPKLISEEDIAERMDSLRETGRPLVTADESVAKRWEDIRLSYPEAENLCRIAGGRDPKDWEKSRPLEPHYLRAPYITTPKK